MPTPSALEQARTTAAPGSSAQAGHLSHPKYRPDIDGLRALAVLSVVGFHAFPAWVSGGFVGVDIFFVVSGFLISTILFENLERNTFSFTEFYSRRITRIFPALLTVLVATYAFGWLALTADEYKQLGKHIAGGTGFVSNFVLWSESGYFDNAAETKPLLHLWSLGIEEQFYIVWPLLLWAAWKKRFNLLTITVVIAVISFALNIRGIQSHAIATFYSPQTRFWELLIGALLAWIRSHPHAMPAHRWPDRIRDAQAWLGAALIAAALALTTKASPFPGWWALLPTLGAAFMIAAGPHAWLNRVILSNRILVWFGLISFPLYLWHWPLLSLARILESEVPAREIRIGVVLLSILLAWLTYRLIERPIRFGLARKAKPVCLLLFMAIAGYAGYNAYLRDGLKFRDPTTDKTYIAQTIEQQFNDKCSLRLEKINHCAGQVKPGQAFVLLVGDSHVRHTYELIKGQTSNSSHGLLAFSNGGCPFLIGVNTSNVNDCDLKNKEVTGFINANKPNIKAVVIAAELTTYVGPDRLKDSNGKSIGLEDALGKTLAALQGIPVILFEQVPTLSFDPKKCLSRPFRISRNKFNCQTSYQEVMASMEKSRKATHEAASRFPHVTLFNVDSALCSKGVCSGILDKQVLYYDKTHLNPAGVDFVRPQIHFDHALAEAIAGSGTRKH